jgi:Xaa-Pro aminopeptidase
MIKVMYSNSHNSDMFYAVKAVIPDAFFYFDINGEKIVFLDHREYKVFEEKKEDKSIKAVLLNPLMDEFGKNKISENAVFNLVYHLFKKYDLVKKEIFVPALFPLDLADFLRSKGIKLTVLNPFFNERETKSEVEINFIEKSLENTYKAYDMVVGILKDSIIKKGEIYFNGNLLSSEYLKYEVEKLFLKNDMACPEGMIISSGGQSAIPHHTGSGPLKANSPIIVDIYPKSRKSGYFADMTRTYFKGEPNKEMVNIYEAVKKVQAEAVQALRPGKTGKEIHLLCVKMFEDMGFPQAGDKGFIHGTGHGLGLDVHETPYLNMYYEKELVPGNIITVEPGLYYPELGGVRIEDDVLITKEGYRNLTSYNKEIIIL